MIKSAAGDDDMDIAKKFLDEGKPLEALERLKKIFPTAADEWSVHELI